jgi:hypothetical protein
MHSHRQMCITCELHPRFQTTRHDVMEQYIIYDSDSFIADVGGFLGLLLGHSAFSIWMSMEIWVVAKMGNAD